MSKNTDELIEKNEKEVKKVTKKSAKEKKENDKKVKEKKIKETKKTIENKSVQNKVIENIKTFISKIVEMQDKVKRDEEEEKEQKKLENEEVRKEVNEQPKYLLEYYDLPFRYNETVVKILAQTPKRLFVYWDVSEQDKQTYLNAFGENFFNDTYPVLLVHNETKNYTNEVVINDFANSWYLDISNPRDKYTIQLGRKFKVNVNPKFNPEIEETNIVLNNDYLFIASSNKLEVPNDHILFEEFKPYVKYRNVKTNQEETKVLTSTIYGEQLKELYNELYDGEINLESFELRNPSSIGTSSSIAK